MMKLISYNETPQVTGLEYSEMRDLKENPQKKSYYIALAKKRRYDDMIYRRKQK